MFAAGLLAAAGTAHATSVAAPIDAAVAYEYFGISYQQYVAYGFTVGALDYTGGAGCAGSCVATTALGADPSATISIDEVPANGGAGGYAEAIVGYFFTPSTSGTVYLHANDVMVPSASGASSQAIVIVGPASSYGSPYTLTYYSSVLYEDTDCTNGCLAGVANVDSPQPLPANQALAVVGGTEYYVYENITISNATNAGQLFAEADPSITSGTPGLTLAFSPGVAAVPEPSTWAMMLLGMAGLGLMLRMRRRETGQLQTAFA
jgi:hypothetical protein